MKKHRTRLFIVLSSIALLVLLIIQVNWILQTARIKEALFNEKAKMILSRTTEFLASDKQTFGDIKACVENDSTSNAAAKLGEKEKHKIDSVFTYYMKLYNFPIDYTFEVVKPAIHNSTYQPGFKNYTYNTPFQEMTGTNRIELKLILPEKKKYILAEMGTLFITSILLIFVVLILFWRTTHSLLKEKKIAENTTEFLNNMTHEFKTPLTNIALAGKMIIKEPMLNREEKIKHYTGIILEENEKLGFQVEQVLSMAALERDEIPLQIKELDFHQLINEVIRRISIQIEQKQGNLQVDLNAEKFVVLGDKIHLANAICNLIDNAIKYSTTKPELFIQTINNGKHLCVLVSDKGIGIEKEFQKKVFDKYFRVPTGNLHNVKGFGLGLAYFKKIIVLHKGTIRLESEINRGSVFTIVLPYA